MTWVLLIAITFIASTVQSAIGFAFALIVVPAYFLLLGTIDGVQVAIILSVVMSVTLLPKLQLDTPLYILKWLAFGCTVGFPIGLYTYNNINLTILKFLLAVFLIVICIQNGLNLFKKNLLKTKHDKITLTITGVLSGILGVVLAMPGPLVMLYLSRTALSRDEIRATMISFFVFIYIAILILQVSIIGIERETWLTSAYLTPAALLGVISGHYISKNINETMFKVLILVILIFTGITMLINI